MSDNDDFDRIMRVIRARCGDVLSDADLAMITQPDEPLGEMLPIEVGAEILDVLDQMIDRLDGLEATVQVGNDIVANVWRAMRDMTISEKVAVLDRLEGLVGMEEASYEPLQ